MECGEQPCNWVPANGVGRASNSRKGQSHLDLKTHQSWALASPTLRRRRVRSPPHRGQIELGEVMVYSRVSDGLSCGYSRFNPCWIKTSHEDALVP